MPCLNDIEKDLIEKKFLIEILFTLDLLNHKKLYHFYLKYLQNSINLIKLENNEMIIYNVKNLLKLLLKVNNLLID